jgi:hypothetical protein
MEALQGILVGTLKPQGLLERGQGGGRARDPRSRCGVKVCPRLEALSFWGCQDLTLNGLVGVVLSRNRRFSTHEEELDRTQKSVHGPNGATQPVTRNLQSGNEGSGHKVEVEAQMGRKIKPLRRMRRHRAESGLSSQENEGSAFALSPSTNIASTIIARQEALQPAHIIYLRVANCKLIDRQDSQGFKDLGVVDFIWAGSD